MNTACRHGRTGSCAYCLAKIQAHHFYELMKWRAELKRKGKLPRGS